MDQAGDAKSHKQNVGQGEGIDGVGEFLDLAVAWSGRLGGNPVPDEDSVTGHCSCLYLPSAQPGPSPFYCAFAAPALVSHSVAPPPTAQTLPGDFLKCRVQGPGPDLRLSGVGPRNLHLDRHSKYFTCTLKSETQGWEGMWRMGSSHTISHQEGVSPHQPGRT